MKLLAILYFRLLSLRYSCSIQGLENLDPSKKYVIFPNHQALVDPQIITSILLQHIPVSPVISETYYHIPVVKSFFEALGAVPMGDIQRGTSTLEEVEQSMNAIKSALGTKNILLYPAGQLYSQGYEVIRGKKAAFEIASNLPEGVEILLVRTTGLWGSMWSKAWEGSTPNILKTFLFSFFAILANGIFFGPKRNVNVEIENHTDAIKKISDSQSLNQYLENFYNAHGTESINYVQHFSYYNDTENKVSPSTISGSVEVSTEKDYSVITKVVLDGVLKKIQEITEMSPVQMEKITPQSSLILDLFLDSLDAAELKASIQGLFKESSNPPITDLKTVGDVCLMAMGKSETGEQLKPCEWSKGGGSSNDDVNVDLRKLIVSELREARKSLGENATIPALIQRMLKQDSSSGWIYDTIFGLQTKREFTIKMLLVAEYIRKIEGNSIGILLPSVSSASLILAATYFAGKTPVMLNWTVGEASLLHCAKFAQVKNILTARSFYDRVKNDGTEKLRDSYVFLEDLLKNVSLPEKIVAALKSVVIPVPAGNENDTAVLLFTSGSESLPKAVPLTHKNILSDLEGALAHFPIAKKDILIGFLPPFHSFGFSVNTILPLVTGLRAAYTPDPNDSKTIAELLSHTKATTLTATPTFLRMILRATDGMIPNLSYAVVGAEKCPESLMKQFESQCPNGKILEGYGITECSPVISINPPNKAKPGTVGLPVEGSEIRILSLDSQEKLPAMKEGMIYFSGENVFAGYLDSSIESPFEILDGKKFYKTGDLGFLDADGYLTITGRLKRFIKIAGEMISLPFIEGILNKKYGSESELTLAVEAREEKGEVKIVVFVIDSLPLKLDEISQKLRDGGASNLVKISQIIQLPQIPVLGTGKTDYKTLKGMIEIEN